MDLFRGNCTSRRFFIDNLGIPLPAKEKIITMIEERARKHGIHLRTEINGIPPSILVDERKLKQVLYNLLSNAVKFTPDGGSIVLSACSELPPQEPKSGKEVWVRIAVHDTGIGIRKEDLERIFAPFEQADNSASREYSGTGMGLSLTKRLVDLHGGRIWAESDGKGKGSRFVLVFPSQPGRVPPENPRKDPNGALKL